MHITFKVICLLSHSVVDANNTAASSVPALMGPHNPIDIDEKKQFIRIWLDGIWLDHLKVSTVVSLLSPY